VYSRPRLSLQLAFVLHSSAVFNRPSLTQELLLLLYPLCLFAVISFVAVSSARCAFSSQVDLLQINKKKQDRTGQDTGIIDRSSNKVNNDVNPLLVPSQLRLVYYFFMILYW